MPTDDSTFSRRKVIAWMEKEQAVIVADYHATRDITGDERYIIMANLNGRWATLHTLAEAMTSGELDAAASEMTEEMTVRH